MSRAWVGKSPVASVGGLRPADSAVTYKGVQAQYDPTPSRRATGTDLQAANVGVVRVIVDQGHTYNTDIDTALFDAVETWIADFRAHGVFPIACIQHYSGVSAVNWAAACTQFATRINAGAYELGNEIGITYSGGTNWNKWFDDAAAASATIKGLPVAPGDPPRMVLLGASVDVDTSPYLTAARTRWGANASGWPFDGVCIHPYGQGGATFSQAAAIASMNAKLTAARTGRVPIGVPLWATECGWGTGGNSNSTLVAGTNSSSTTSVGSQTIPASGTFSFTVANANPGSPFVPFTASGQLWMPSAGGAGDVVISYTAKAGNVFTGCQFVAGATGAVTNGTLVAQEWDTSAGRKTSQDQLLTSMYDSLWRRRFTTDAQVTAAGGTTPALNLKNIGWFWWRDKTTPRQWWHYCGLRAVDGTANTSYASYANAAVNPATKPLS